jgi:hypothetical protein
MKDKSYTIRASLGPIDNPFLISGIAGNTSWTSLPAHAAATQSTLSTTLKPTARTGASGLALLASSTGDSTVDPSTNYISSSGGLSIGAKAGIGVGVGVSGLAAAILIALFLFRRRAHAHKKRSKDDAGAAELHNQDAEIHEASVSGAKHELDSSAMNEMQGADAANEVHAVDVRIEADSTPRAELDGATHERYELESPTSIDMEKKIYM